MPASRKCHFSLLEHNTKTFSIARLSVSFVFWLIVLPAWDGDKREGVRDAARIMCLPANLLSHNSPSNKHFSSNQFCSKEPKLFSQNDIPTCIEKQSQNPREVSPAPRRFSQLPSPTDLSLSTEHSTVPISESQSQTHKENFGMYPTTKEKSHKEQDAPAVLPECKVQVNLG